MRQTGPLGRRTCLKTARAELFLILPWCATSEALEGFAEVALVGKSGVSGEGGKIGPTALKLAADKLHAQPIHVVRHSTAVALLENPGKVNRMDLHVIRNTF